MIDMIEAKRIFLNYVSKFDNNNASIVLKRDHSIRVSHWCSLLATHLELSEEDIVLAELIGLLHDIGRFDQADEYNTFNDFKSIDHAKHGCVLLFDSNMIKDYVDDSKYNNIIMEAIYSHSRLKDPEVYDNKTLLFCKIIRDADKLDLLEMDGRKTYQYDIDNENISNSIYDYIFKHQLADKKDIEYELDKVVAELSFIFDINFDYSLKIIQEKKYIEIIINNIITNNEDIKNKINKIEEEIENYMSDRLGEKLC